MFQYSVFLSRREGVGYLRNANFLTWAIWKILILLSPYLGGDQWKLYFSPCCMFAHLSTYLESTSFDTAR